MIVEDSENSSPTDDEQVNESEQPSRSSRRRDALAIRALATEIAELSPTVRATLPIPEDAVAGFDELDRITKFNARKRQIGFITKRLRDHDLEPLEQAMLQRRLAHDANSAEHHELERWRDRLLGLDPLYSSAEALTAWFDSYPDSPRQELKQLQNKGLKEIERSRELSRKRGEDSKPTRRPPSARALFKLLRSVHSGEI